MAKLPSLPHLQRSSENRPELDPSPDQQMGAVISIISWMMWRGVWNWPFCPALAILPSMYS